MAAEFAAVEGCPLPADVPDRPGRLYRTKTLNQALNAAQTLEDLSQAMKCSDEYVQSVDRASYYLVTYDKMNRRVKVKPYFKLGNFEGSETEDIVLVEAGKLEIVKYGFPNYFGDVQLFKSSG